MIFCIDFDGTCVTHAYPEIGKEIGAVPVLKKIIENRHKIILWTMRDDMLLVAACRWFAKYRIPLYGINRNPAQHTWTNSPKAYADIYIDDSAMGIPLVYPEDNSRPYVDWAAIQVILMSNKLI